MGQLTGLGASAVRPSERASPEPGLGAERSVADRDAAWFLREIVPKLDGYSLSQIARGDGTVARGLLAHSRWHAGPASEALGSFATLVASSDLCIRQAGPERPLTARRASHGARGDAIIRVPAGALPTGTVTLLFSDIEGSTQHWQRQREAMAVALCRHDQLVRTAIEAHNGHVFKTVGDAFCAAFWRAPDAVAAALDAQRALTSEDFSAVGGLRVRMALHSGTADERDGDYFGPAPNRVAQLLAVVHGGRIVISGATAQLLRGVMPEKVDLRDLGEHRLKDLVEPEQVWQCSRPAFPRPSRPYARWGRCRITCRGK